MPLSVPRANAKSGASKKRNPEVKGRQDTQSLERTEFDAKLSQPEQPTSFRPRGRKKGEPGEKEAERGTRGRRRDRYRQRRQLHFSEHWVPSW